MRFLAYRRFIAASALFAFLFATAFPVLAVARQAVDPLAFAKICRIDSSTIAGQNTTVYPGSLQAELKSAHCLMCVGTASPPPQISLAPMAVARVAEFVIPVDRRPLLARDAAALQPLNPRAPPRA